VGGQENGIRGVYETDLVLPVLFLRSHALGFLASTQPTAITALRDFPPLAAIANDPFSDQVK